MNLQLIELAPWLLICAYDGHPVLSYPVASHVSGGGDREIVMYRSDLGLRAPEVKVTFWV